MKHSWFPIVVVAGVLSLLAGLALLQYHWQRQVSEASRDKMQKRVDTDASRFAEDFNKEIQAVYFNFQTGPEGWREGQPREFNERYEYWKSKTTYPELIKDFYFFENQADSPTLRYDRDAKRFVPVDPPGEIQTLRGRILLDNDVRSIYEDANALVLPILGDEHRLERIMIRRTSEEMPIVRIPDRIGNLVMVLDRVTITDRILPELVQKYFADGEYKVAVMNKDDNAIFGSTTGADASAPLFELSPDKFIMFASRDALPHAEEAKSGGMIVNQRVETLSRGNSINGETSGTESGTFNVQFQRGGELPRTQVFSRTGVGEPWKLNVQNQAGSIAAYIDNSFHRNLAIGAGLYASLATAILGIFYSAQRAKKFAQRQVDFVSSVSHEFRTPLAVIYSAGENLADGVAADAAHVERYGRLIKGEGRKLSTMVEQILEFAGANSGKQKYNFAEADVADIVNEAVAESKPLIESGGFEIETDIQNSLPGISGDRTALSRALQNLIANSIKYSNDSKWLRVSATNGGGAVKISVEDKGVGISPRDLRHIFEPFYRSKEVVDSQIHGNGLGLSVVKQIAEAHNGKVSATSEPGKGSTFTIELPQI